jgi:hypothetical protein
VFVRYSDRLGAVLGSRAWGKNVTVINKAIGGTSAGYLLLCLSDLLAENPDVVILEVIPNLAHTYVPLNSESFLVVERLVRRILLWRSSPAVVLLHLMLPPRFGDFINRFYNTQEDGVNVLAQYYGLPVLSMRNCLYHWETANATGFRMDELRVLDITGKGYFHHSSLGHSYITQALYHLFRAAYAIRPRAKCKLPPAHLMLPDNVDGQYMSCYSGHALQPLVHNNTGWVFKADDSQQKKWGLISKGSGQTMSLRITNRGQLAVFVAYLTSWDNMGAATLSCLKDCQCTSVVVNASIAERVSVTEIAVLNVTVAGEDCYIHVATTLNSRGKFKVIGIMEAKGDDELLFKGWFKRAGFVRK